VEDEDEAVLSNSMSPYLWQNSWAFLIPPFSLATARIFEKAQF
jgi:hypothetical protein